MKGRILNFMLSVMRKHGGSLAEEKLNQIYDLRRA